jgi:DNA-binding CsgD family transcriptional regulator
MTLTVTMGIPGLHEVGPGTHICALYSSQAERDNLLFPFLRAGIREGDKCLCLIDDPEPAVVRDQVERQQNGHQQRRSEQLDIDRTSDVYLHAGRFSVDHMVSFLAGSLNRAAESDFPLLRAAGEMSWMLPQPGAAEDFFVYESAVTKIVEDQPAVFMCMYDLQRFGVSMLVDVLKTHAMVLLEGMVLENPTPQEYPDECRPSLSNPMPFDKLDADDSETGSATYPLATVPKARPGTAWSDPWWTLTDAELRVAELVAGGLTNRNIAEYLNLSPHTVDAHLKHTYIKLNIHSRVELTVLALQHR